MANFKNSVLGSLPPVTKNIILINVILFLIESLFPNLLSKLGYNGDVNQLLGLHFWAAPSFNPVQFVTYMANSKSSSSSSPLSQPNVFISSIKRGSSSG